MAPSPSTSRAIVVTDMSGFTRITRQHGIVHMMSLIWKMRQTIRALFLAYGATRITTEADDVLAAFPDPAKALAAALQVQAVIDKQNEASDESLVMTMGGLGVGFGDLVDEHHLFSGQAFFDAFLLGEDLANKREVAITDAVRVAVTGSDLFTDISFEERSNPEYHDGKESFYIPTTTVKELFHFDPAKFSAMTEIGDIADSIGLPVDHRLVAPFVVPLLSRFTSDEAGRAAIDKQLQDRFFIDATVVMYGAEWDDVAVKGPDVLRETKHKAREIAREVVTSNGGYFEGDNLFVFMEPVNAFVATLQLRDALVKFGEVPLKGIGAHLGKVLFMEDTDLHYGDPVNTASKLGEDFAEPRQVLYSAKMYDAVKEAVGGMREDDAMAKMVAKTGVKEIALNISGVDMNAFVVQD